MSVPLIGDCACTFEELQTVNYKVHFLVCLLIFDSFQARPITTMEQEMDEEFMHEFDSPVSTNTERLTLGNIG